MGYYAKNNNKGFFVYWGLIAYLAFSVAMLIWFGWWGMLILSILGIGFYYWAGEYHVKR